MTRLAASIAFACLGVGFTAFYAVALLLSLADHDQLPLTLGKALIDYRRKSDPMTIVFWVWLGLQLIWMVPAIIQAKRSGAASAMLTARWLAAAVGYGGLVLLVIILLALFAIGHPPR